MSSIPQNTENRKAIFDSAPKFLKEFQVGKILFLCNAGKMKGIPVMDIFRYLFCLIFSDRSMFMQRKTGVFEGGFCKNTVYRFLNSPKTNWQRFTTLLSARIINELMKPLTSEDRKDVFIIDDSLFDRSRSSKTELLAKVFDHCSMKYKRGYRMLTLGWSDETLLFRSIIACFLQRMIKICFVKLLFMMDVPLLENAGNSPVVRQPK